MTIEELNADGWHEPQPIEPQTTGIRPSRQVRDEFLETQHYESLEENDN